MFNLFLDGLGHYRIQKNYPGVFQLNSPITGDIFCGIVHTSPKFRTNVVCDGSKRKVKKWPLKVSTKLPTIYRTIMLEGENIKVHGAIVSLVDEDILTLEFPLLSSEVPDGLLADARLQELLILPIHPHLKFSKDEVFISKDSIALRPDQPLDIQIVSVMSEERKKKIKKLNKKKTKLRFPKLKDEVEPSSPKRRKIADSHGQCGSRLQEKFAEDLELLKTSNPQVIEAIEETLASKQCNLIDVLHLGLSRMGHESPSAE